MIMSRFSSTAFTVVSAQADCAVNEALTQGLQKENKEAAAGLKSSRLAAVFSKDILPGRITG